MSSAKAVTMVRCLAASSAAMASRSSSPSKLSNSLNVAARVVQSSKACVVQHGPKNRWAGAA